MRALGGKNQSVKLKEKEEGVTDRGYWIQFLNRDPDGHRRGQRLHHASAGWRGGKKLLL